MQLEHEPPHKVTTMTTRVHSRENFPWMPTNQTTDWTISSQNQPHESKPVRLWVIEWYWLNRRFAWTNEPPSHVKAFSMLHLHETLKPNIQSVSKRLKDLTMTKPNQRNRETVRCSHGRAHDSWCSKSIKTLRTLLALACELHLLPNHPKPSPPAASRRHSPNGPRS